MTHTKERDSNWGSQISLVLWYHYYAHVPGQKYS